jgi:hypothetical protein
MTEKEFYRLLSEMRELAHGHSFRVNHHYYSPGNFGTFNITMTNGPATCRINNKRGQMIIEVKKEDGWQKISEFIANNFPGDPLNADIAAHGLYEKDFSFASNLKFLPRFLDLIKQSRN